MAVDMHRSTMCEGRHHRRCRHTGLVSARSVHDHLPALRAGTRWRAGRVTRGTDRIKLAKKLDVHGEGPPMRLTPKHLAVAVVVLCLGVGSGLQAGAPSPPTQPGHLGPEKLP